MTPQDQTKRGTNEADHGAGALAESLRREGIYEDRA